ncbi:MAG: hypothetical protein ABL956_08355 [Hyphomonadaceae bacterium]
MSLRLAVFALAAAFACPTAFGQALMQNFSWPEMRQALESEGSTIIAEGADGDIRYFDAKSEDNLNFTVFGFECDTNEPTQRCSGALLAASLTPKDDDALAKGLDAIDSLSVDDRTSPRKNIRLTRYIIFGGGIAAGNLQENISVFLSTSQNAWKMLGDKDLLK